MAFKFWLWEENGTELSGKLTAKLNNIPPWGKRVYGIETKKGELWYIWGTSVLVGKLAPLPFLTEVSIRFLGKGRDSPKDKFDKKLFEVKVINMPNKIKTKKQKNARRTNRN